MAMTLVICLTAAALRAADPPSIGTRVRALGAAGLEIEGTLSAYGAHDLTISTRDGRGATTIGFDRIAQLQVPAGRDHLAGFGLGVVAGLLAAIGAGLFAVRDFEGCVEGGCALYAIYYGFLTVPLGAIIGTAVAPRRWRDVPLPPAIPPGRAGIGFRMNPVRGGARFALTYGF